MFCLQVVVQAPRVWQPFTLAFLIAQHSTSSTDNAHPVFRPSTKLQMRSERVRSILASVSQNQLSPLGNVRRDVFFSGAGVQSMTFGYGPSSQPDGWSETVLTNQEAEDCLIPIGITSENVASDFNISCQKQDEFSAKSFQKAAAAQKAGKFRAEIVPLKVKIVDPKTKQEGDTC